jgi:hypothetical protein
MTPADAILVAFIAALPYADRAASRKHAAALEAKAGGQP